MSTPSPNLSSVVDERELRHVLEHAARLDGRRLPYVTAEEVRKLGDDLGLSPDSVRSALAAANRARRAPDPLDLLMGGFVVGILFRVRGITPDSDLVWIYFSTTTAMLAVYLRARGIFAYLRGALTLAIGSVTGWAIVGELMAGALSAWHAVPIAVGLVLGLAGIALTDALRQRSPAEWPD